MTLAASGCGGSSSSGTISAGTVASRPPAPPTAPPPPPACAQLVLDPRDVEALGLASQPAPSSPEDEAAEQTLAELGVARDGARSAFLSAVTELAGADVIAAVSADGRALSIRAPAPARARGACEAAARHADALRRRLASSEADFLEAQLARDASHSLAAAAALERFEREHGSAAERESQATAHGEQLRRARGPRRREALARAILEANLRELEGLRLARELSTAQRLEGWIRERLEATRVAARDGLTVAAECHRLDCADVR